MTTCYLRMESDFLSESERHSSVKSAITAYRAVAEDLMRFGQRIEASIHFGNSLEEIVEYPDYVLSLGPRGGVKVERA